MIKKNESTKIDIMIIIYMIILSINMMILIFYRINRLGQGFVRNRRQFHSKSRMLISSKYKKNRYIKSISSIFIMQIRITNAYRINQYNQLSYRQSEITNTDYTNALLRMLIADAIIRYSDTGFLSLRMLITPRVHKRLLWAANPPYGHRTAPVQFSTVISSARGVRSAKISGIRY